MFMIPDTHFIKFNLLLLASVFNDIFKSKLT
jgi:hypothetical protein